jgi:hypothetical protein
LTHAGVNASIARDMGAEWRRQRTLVTIAPE